jgi:preprotein translocase subunit SecD
MIGSSHRVPNKKAGLSGLFREYTIAAVLLMMLSSAVAAEPLVVEVTNVSAGLDLYTKWPTIRFKMAPTSARLFAELTTKNVGRKVEIRIDSKIVSAPVIREPILGGSGHISNNSWTLNEAKEIADRLSAGKAQVEYEIVDK